MLVSGSSFALSWRAISADMLDESSMKWEKKLFSAIGFSKFKKEWSQGKSELK